MSNFYLDTSNKYRKMFAGDTNKNSLASPGGRIGVASKELDLNMSRQNNASTASTQALVPSQGRASWEPNPQANQYPSTFTGQDRRYWDNMGHQADLAISKRGKMSAQSLAEQKEVMALYDTYDQKRADRAVKAQKELNKPGLMDWLGFGLGAISQLTGAGRRSSGPQIPKGHATDPYAHAVTQYWGGINY